VEKWDLEILARSMCMDEKCLPAGLERELATLQQMLETAVQGAPAGVPQPPAYGQEAYQRDDEAALMQGRQESTGSPFVLREDVAVPYDTVLIGLSPRQEGGYVTVPKVIHE